MTITTNYKEKEPCKISDGLIFLDPLGPVYYMLVQIEAGEYKMIHLHCGKRKDDKRWLRSEHSIGCLESFYQMKCLGVAKSCHLEF